MKMNQGVKERTFMKFSSRSFRIACLALLAVATMLLVSTVSFAVTELRVRTVWGGVQKEHLDKMFAEYSKANPGIKISHDVVAGTGAGTYTEMLRTALISEVGPDIWFNWGGTLAGFFIDAGYAEPLEGYYEKYDWDKIIIPWAKKSIMRQGKIWGVPVATHGMTLWYRVDLWKKLGLTEPKTYAEVEALCEKVKAGGIYPISLAGKYGWMVMRLVDYMLEVSCGPEMHDSLNILDVSWNSPEVVKAYQMFKKWADNWIVPGFLAISPDDARMPMYRGKALMVLEGSWMETVFKQDEQDVYNFDFFIHPTDREPVRISAFPEQFTINAQSKHKDEAAELINWFVQPEIQNRMLGKAMTSTGTIGVAPDKKELPRTYKWRKVLEEVRDVFPPTDQAFTPELMHFYFEIQDSLVTGTVTPEEGAKKMQERIEEWKAKEGAEWKKQLGFDKGIPW